LSVHIFVAWRIKNDVDTVLDSPFQVDKNFWHHSFHGRDKLGRPIFIERTGNLDVKTLVNKGYKMETLIRAHIYHQEYVARLTEEASKYEGRKIEQTLSILDLEGAGVWIHLNGYAREFFTILSGIAQNYYPERLAKLVVINAPRAFPMAWNFVKPLLDVNTQNKIIMPSYGNQTKALLDLVEPCFLPMKFGGTCDCEQRGCFVGPNPVNFVDALRYDEGTPPNRSLENPPPEIPQENPQQILENQPQQNSEHHHNVQHTHENNLQEDNHKTEKVHENLEDSSEF